MPRDKPKRLTKDKPEATTLLPPADNQLSSIVKPNGKVQAQKPRTSQNKPQSISAEPPVLRGSRIETSLQVPPSSHPGQAKQGAERDEKNKERNVPKRSEDNKDGGQDTHLVPRKPTKSITFKEEDGSSEASYDSPEVPTEVNGESSRRVSILAKGSFTAIRRSSAGSAEDRRVNLNKNKKNYSRRTWKKKKRKKARITGRKSKAKLSTTSSSIMKRETLGSKLKRCVHSICPHFPLCWNFPIVNWLQIWCIIDIGIVLVNIAIWFYFHQVDPFTLSRTAAMHIQNARNQGPFLSKEEPSGEPTETNESLKYHSIFQETSTVGYETVDKNLLSYYYADGENFNFSKIGEMTYARRQDVLNFCDRKYYDNFLVGEHLIKTNHVFTDMLIIIYVTELGYLFIDISILVSTCCFFSYTSGRMFLIIIWNLAFFPILGKIYACILSRSTRLCILQYGFGKFHGLEAMLIMNFLPMIGIRMYELLVLTSYIANILELGNLEHETRIQGMTLHEYLHRQDEYLRMDRNRSASTTADEDAENA